VTLQEQIRSNRLRTGLVLLMFGVLMAALATATDILFSPSAAFLIGVAAIIYGIISWFAAGRMVAAAAGARPVTKGEAPELVRAVENAAIGAGLTRTPDVYIVDDPAPNAFAAGTSIDKAYVAATTGLLQKMNQRELEGVVAHEMAHVRNRDVRLMSLAAVLVGIIALACDLLIRMAFWGGSRDRNQNPIATIIGIVAILLAPLAAGLLQMALSRRREYQADATAAEITGDPEGLAMALAVLRDDKTPMEKVTRATAHLYIESPLRDHSGLRSSLGGLFDTHPPLEDRIARLAKAGGFPPP
jgi:heat shock protein HtpX